MGDDRDDTQRKIEEEDRAIRQRFEQREPEEPKRPGYQDGSSGSAGGAVGEGTPEHQSGIARGLSIGGEAETPGASAGATRDEEIRSDFERASGGNVGGFDAGEGVRQADSPGAATPQSPGTVGTIGGQSGDEYGAQRLAGSDNEKGTVGERLGQQEPLGADHEHSAKGGSVTAAGGGSAGPGPGQTGTDRKQGFVGSKSEESGEYLQDRDPQEAGFAEQGRGAPDNEEGGDIERGGERSANRSTDIEGSSER